MHYVWGLAESISFIEIPYFAVEKKDFLALIHAERPDIDTRKALTIAERFENGTYGYCALWMSAAETQYTETVLRTLRQTGPCMPYVSAGWTPLQGITEEHLLPR